MLNKQMLRLDQFAGLNQAVDPLKIDDFEAIRSLDLYQNFSTGEITKREPFTNLSPPSTWPTANIPWMGIFTPDGTTTKYIMGIDTAGNRIQTYRYPAATVVQSTSVAAYSGIRCGLQYNNKYYWLSPTGIYEATEANINAGFAGAIIAGSPGTVAGCMFKERMWVIDNTNLSRVRYSNAGDPTTWGGASFIDVMPGDGQSVTSVIPLFNDKLLIFKQRSVYVLYVLGADTASWQLKPLHLSYGASYHDNVKFFEGTVYFASPRGVCRTDGTEVQCISDKLYFNSPFSALVNGTEQIDVDNVPYAGIVNRHYVLTSLQKNIAAYNIDLGIWTMWSLPSSGSNIADLGFFIDTDGMAGTSLGTICTKVSGSYPATRFIGSYVANKNAASGGIPTVDSPIPRYITKRYDLGAPDIYKRWLYLDITVLGEGTWTVSTTTEAGTSTPVGILTTSGAAINVTVLRYKVFRYAKSLQVNVSFDGYTDPVKLYTVNLAYTAKTLTPKLSARV